MPENQLHRRRKKFETDADGKDHLLLPRRGKRPLPYMHLHVVSFDIPWPANYGGVQVVFYQLKALHRLGVRVILHCFRYGERKPAAALSDFCREVHYYARPRSWRQHLSTEPFIVQTRKSRALLERLCCDDYPILFEGIHTAGWLPHPALRRRRKVLRMHNIEWQYYGRLSGLAPSLRERLFFRLESLRLRRAEARLLPFADEVLALSPAEAAYFARYCVRTHYLPAFHPYEQVCGLPGKGEYALFHGKLSVPDNERAAIWLIQSVFASLPAVRLLIAGTDPSPRLFAAADRWPNVALVANPTEEQMDALIRQAQVQVLVSFLSTGVKLKLLNALFRGRHCVVNEPVLSGTPLRPLCTVANGAADLQQAIRTLMETPFEERHLAERRALLEVHYANHLNARHLMAIIAGEPYSSPGV